MKLDRSARRLVLRGVGGAALAMATFAFAAPTDVGNPALRLSTELGAPGAATEEQRAAARAAWRDLTMRADDRLQLQREGAERELLLQLEAARRQQAQMTDIERRLAEVRAQRYANPFVYALAVLVTLVAGAVLWFWRRARG